MHTSTIKIVFVMLVISFIIFIGMAMSKNGKEVVAVRTGCIPTELYVIGNQNRVARVYDCSNLEEEDNE